MSSNISSLKKQIEELLPQKYKKDELGLELEKIKRELNNKNKENSSLMAENRRLRDTEKEAREKIHDLNDRIDKERRR